VGPQHPRRGRERLEQPPLGGREMHRFVPAPNGSRRDIDDQVLRHEPRARRLRRRSAQQRPNPRQELGRAEGLRQVVVGAEVQRRDLVLLRVADREDEDRYPAGAPDLPARREAVHVGEVQVQHHEIRRIVEDGADGGAAVARRSHHVATRGQRALDRTQDLRLVVHDQHDRVAHVAAGIRTPKVAPPPGVSVAQISPSIATAKPLQIASPIPAPNRGDPSASR
jgi:hypothetical protein